MANDELKRMGARLRRLRRERGLSLGEVAKATDISQSFLSHVENRRDERADDESGRAVPLTVHH